MPTTNLERLREIERLCREILGTLDNSHAPCECCTGKRYRNWSDHCVAERVEAARAKMHGLAKGQGDWMQR